MDTGELITILFWGAVILFSILQSVVQQKKQQQKKERMEGAEGLDFPGVEDEGRRAEESAEGMVPEDVWEEISGLARGGRDEPEEPVSVEARGRRSSEERTPAEAASYEDLVEEAGPVRAGEIRAEHPIHRSHADYGTDPSTRRPVRPRPTAPSGPGGPLSDFGREDLRRAVLLHEVLGPPVSKREKGRGGR